MCVYVWVAGHVLQTTSDPERFVLHPQPLDYNYAEFERLLLGIAYHVYLTKKKGGEFHEVCVCVCVCG